MGIVAVNDKLLAMSMHNESDRSFLRIYDKDLNLLKEIEHSKYGSYQYKVCINQDKVYFSIGDNQGSGQSSIMELNLKDYSIKSFETDRNLNDVLIYKDKLLSFHYDDKNFGLTTLVEYDLKTFNVTKKHEFKKNLSLWTIKDDNLYAIEMSVDSPINTLHKISILKDYEITNSLDLPQDNKDYFVSKIFNR